MALDVNDIQNVVIIIMILFLAVVNLCYICTLLNILQSIVPSQYLMTIRVYLVALQHVKSWVQIITTLIEKEIC